MNWQEAQTKNRSAGQPISTKNDLILFASHLNFTSLPACQSYFWQLIRAWDHTQWCSHLLEINSLLLNGYLLWFHKQEKSCSYLYNPWCHPGSYVLKQTQKKWLTMKGNEGSKMRFEYGSDILQFFITQPIYSIIDYVDNISKLTSIFKPISRFPVIFWVTVQISRR